MTPVVTAAPPERAAVPREKDYDWGRTLGEGTFGTVKLGTVKTPGFSFPVVTGRTYAVKLIQKKFIMEKKNKEIVFRERKILEKLKHPFIVTLHYTFQTDPALNFVMDYCANGELYEHIRKMGSLSEECARWYLAEIVVALEHMHGQGIVHRDLKPENILLNEDWHIKVIDFGTAKDVGRGRTSSFEGTPEYMSPELLGDKKELDTRADLWALGVMLFQFLTGKLLVRGSTPWETMRKVREREFEPFPDFFPPVAKDLCEKLLVSEPDERLGSNGFDEIKSHPFFEGIDWEGIVTATPPPLASNPNVPKPAETTRRASSSSLPNLDEVEAEADETEVIVQPTAGRPAATSVESEEKAGRSGSGIFSSSPRTDPEDIEANTSEWKEFLGDTEKVLRAALVHKKRRVFNVKRRQLLLTDAPRIIYIDPATRKEMGRITFDIVVKAIAKDPAHFIIQTKKRDYSFEDKAKNAQAWVDAINKHLIQ